ncbi:MAG: ABC transporter ATP-binding protein [Defluviitaleaceae bacterium]|nr:ABC transporter ATP-binding protein [Defluviitaleaceae bacterium]
MSNILELKNVSKKYSKNFALNNVNFNIEKGCIMGLLGPNGSGKTTLIKIITGLLTNYSGDVLINDNSPGYFANKYISYLPDKQHIPTWLKVKESIKFFEDFYEDFDKERAADMISKMDVPFDSKIKNLSRGQIEKVTLSLVMSRRAKLYILDEPIGAVDPASRDFIIETILKNAGNESSILISTHIISDVEPILNKAIFLKKGEVILSGDVESIRKEQQKSIDEIFREVFKNVI